jgi:alkylation response protein AidB-like acyl-CoA dehydrogenase
MQELEQYRAAAALEQYLGDPACPDNALSFARAVALDERDAYPEEACAIIEEWGFYDYCIPVEAGGKLAAFEQFLSLVRVIARRDLTAAIALGKNYLGSVHIWVGGTEAQQRRAACLMKMRKQLSLALSEKAHGSDLLASEVKAVRTADAYLLSGEKWLINNATRGAALTVFARTEEDGGARGFSLFFVEKELVGETAYAHLPKVKTHGIRGADISGISFKDASVPAAAMIGPPGAGLEVTLKGLMITRTLCAGLSLGAADAALRATLDFALTRKLYGGTLFDLPAAQHALVDAFLDLLICDCVTTAAARGLHVAPEQFSVWSAVVKYFVPTTVENSLRNLAVILGARFYLREEHLSGMFQKLLRDNAIVSLFDGSTVVNLHAIALQLRRLAAHRAGKRARVEEMSSRLAAICALDQPLPPFTPSRLALSNRGQDDLLQGVASARQQLHAVGQESDVDARVCRMIDDMAGRLLLELDEQGETLAKPEMRSEQSAGKAPELFELSRQYCTMHAAAACLHLWLHNRKLLGGFFARGEWLALALNKLLGDFPRSRSVSEPSLVEQVAADLQRLYRENKFFSVSSFQVVARETARRKSA